MKKMKKCDWVMCVIMLIIITVISLWCIDISVSAMLAGPDSIVTNGWMTRSPMLSYHIGIYGVLLSTFAIVAIATHSLLSEEEK